MNQTVAVITVGNSGVGKSYLDNLIVGREVFEHKTKPGSVTDKVETDNAMFRWEGRDVQVIVYNIPGLIEAKVANLERNKAALEQAFTSSATQIVIYVVGNEGGRPSSQDLHCFVQFQKAYQIQPQSLMFVFNKIPADWGREEHSEFLELVQEHLPAGFRDLPVLFFPLLGSRPTIHDPAAVEPRKRLLGMIASRVPVHHVKHHDPIFNAEAVAKLNADIQELRDKIRGDREAYEGKLAENQAAIAYWQRVAEDNARRAQEAAAQGGGGGGCVSANTLVRIKQNGKDQKIETIPITNLRPGHYLEVAPNEFEPMLEYYHFDQNLPFQFYQVQLASGIKLELTDSHWIRTRQPDGKDEMKWGIHLSIGDKLYVRAEEGNFVTQAITHVQVVRLNGVFAPNTWKGVFLTAEGIEVSCYSDLNNYAIVSNFMKLRNMILFFNSSAVDTVESEEMWKNKVIDLEQTKWVKAIRWGLGGLFK